MGEDYVMWNGVDLVNLVQKFLPNKADIIVMESPYKKPAIITADIDGDGKKEVIAAYTFNNEAYLVVLKRFYNGWCVKERIKGRGYNVTYLKAAPVTNKKTKDLIVGWQLGTIWSYLSILKWENNRFKEMIKDKVAFSKMEVDFMPSTEVEDGTVEIALWRHFTGEGYDIEVYRWRKGKLTRALDVYPYYFKKVIWYYKMKLKEMGDIGFYWYFLGNAQYKAGLYEEALYSINKMLKSESPFPSKEELLRLKNEIIRKLNFKIEEHEEFIREVSAVEEVKESAQQQVNLYPAANKEVGGTVWGYINSKGEFIIKPKFDYAMDFEENGLAVVGVNNLQGIIDEEGNYVVQPEYGSISGFSEGRASIIDKEGFKVINEKGKILTSKAYDFIGTYKEGRAMYGKTNEAGRYVYGYLDLEGKEVIPANYDSAGDFNDGKAVVKVKENQYALIDLVGKVLNTYNYYFVGSLGDGLLPFSKGINDKYGYMDEKGTVVIEPKFQWGGNFSEGRAIINMSDNFLNRYGVIDKKGNYIIDPKYNNINFLGEGRIALGKAIDEEKPYIGSIYAIADTEGNILTDFVFSNVLNFEKGVASASDGKNTFFIDRNGKVVTDLPIVEGDGSLSLEGDIIKVNIDYRTYYLDKKGNSVWQENTIIPLDNQYRVIEEKYKPNKDYLVYYPRVQGMKDVISQQDLNESLKEFSLVKPIDSKTQLEYNYSGDFSVEFFKDNLLILELNGYEYYFGAAHGMPSQTYVHINLSNGRIYELKDLFNENSNYVQVISDIVAQQIKDMGENSYIFPDTYKGIRQDQPFYVDENNLYVYFTPYEIAAYAAGFPTFKIPFKDIMNIINTKGEFWRSFHETSVDQ